jgi:hypothetical protein
VSGNKGRKGRENGGMHPSRDAEAFTYPTFAQINSETKREMIPFLCLTENDADFSRAVKSYVINVIGRDR